MTTTTLRATVRRRINQTDNTNTNFTDAMIDELGNQARRMFAAVLPESILEGLRTSTGLSLIGGNTAYPTDYLRSLKNPRVLVDSVWASKIDKDQTWRLRYLESNDNVKSGSGTKYYWETESALRVLPTDATTLTFPYIAKPADLSGVDDATMPPDVDDMVIDYVFEKLMGTRRGDKELAVILARNRGLLVNRVTQKEAV